MSAYICEREHFIYLVEAAQAMDSRFQWWDGKNSNAIHSFEEKAEAANMLVRENLASVSHRYPCESSGTLPGTSSNLIFKDYDFHSMRWNRFDRVQVIKACDCYRYQSCEHDGWEKSAACNFIERLKGAAIRGLPGYDGAEWGAPKPHHAAGKVVDIFAL